MTDTQTQEIEHAGYKRYILSRNPPRLDEDGDELDDDEIDEEADAAARAENVYGDIRLEGKCVESLKCAPRRLLIFSSIGLT
jgi:hypothetical protein